MAMKNFDKKFGEKFIADLPTTPGIYRVFNQDGHLIYVGKAKNLRRRLSQYRNAKRRKRHFKMRKVVEDAAQIEIECFASELEACLAEARIIQEQRPKWNVAGAFYFYYPMIGVCKNEKDELELIYTTEPDAIPASISGRFSFHGAFRSRHLCGNAFFGLIELLEHVGHKNKTQKFGKHSYLYSFRQIPESWFANFNLLFQGEKATALEELLMTLVEKKGARKKAKEIQTHFKALKLFWKHEALLLKKVRKNVNFLTYPVPQKERDILFLKNRYHLDEVPSKEETISVPS
jgi:predicted GIY-YIG superfamily endonuclease